MLAYKKVIFILLLLVTFMALSVMAETIAVVVNKKLPIDNIRTAELRRIFLGEQHQWNDRKKIFAINLGNNDETRKKFQKVIIGMSTDEIKKYWMDEKIKGKSIKQPNVQKSTRAVIAFVKKLPTAISYLPLEEAKKHKELKILKIDGKAPGDDGYILK